MAQGLKATFALLSRTPNEAAVRVLIPALDSPHAQIREQALVAILSRSSMAGHREVVARLDTLEKTAQDHLRKHSSRIGRSLRMMIVSGETPWCVNACRLLAWLREYDLVPALILALENPSHPGRELAGKTLLDLAQSLDEELRAATEPEPGRRDPEATRRQVVAALERSVERFGNHERKEVVAAFLRLAPTGNAMLRQLLRKPRHPAYPVLVELLSTDVSFGPRLLLAMLDDPDPPAAALGLISRRCDEPFVRELLGKTEAEPTAAARHNLKRMDALAWLRPKGRLLDNLDDALQQAAVRLAMKSDLSRDESFRVVGHVLLHGKPGGRRAASEALLEFHGPEANALVLAALEDRDGQVQANAAAQLRRRGIPGALARLMGLVDSPHTAVRQVVRESLTEFSFKRFLSAFDMLEEDVRKSTGALVKKIDPEIIPLLYAELTSTARSRRLRGLAIAVALDMVRQLEDPILELLHDDDHLVRADAAAALAQGDSRESRDALEEALRDRSPTVQDAAAKSLEQRKQFSRPPVRVNEPTGPRGGSR